jgi:hypothetical protein
MHGKTTKTIMTMRTGNQNAVPNRVLHSLGLDQIYLRFLHICSITFIAFTPYILPLSIMHIVPYGPHKLRLSESL